jgi:phenylacetate-CoA ligase
VTRYAAGRAPFWRERVPRARVTLGALPITTKADLMESFDELVTDRRPRLDGLLEHPDQIQGDELHRGEYRVMTSSGSSGRKAILVYDRAGWSGIAAMFLRRSDWTGATPRLPRLRLAIVWGASSTHMSRRGARALDEGLHRLLPLSVTQPIPELVARVNEFQPHHLTAYPSAATLLAEEQEAGRLPSRPRPWSRTAQPLTRPPLSLLVGLIPSGVDAIVGGWREPAQRG